MLDLLLLRRPLTLCLLQMLRGAELLFAAIFSVTFLKRTLNRNNIIGIACCLVSAWSLLLLQNLFNAEVDVHDYMYSGETLLSFSQHSLGSNMYAQSVQDVCRKSSRVFFAADWNLWCRLLQCPVRARLCFCRHNAGANSAWHGTHCLVTGLF